MKNIQLQNEGLILDWNECHQDYLHDESRLCGKADSIALPADEEEVRRVVSWVSSAGGGLTIQGARTGIAGGRFLWADAYSPSDA
ncbi:MAG: hypothetical protein WCG36_01555 [bacterium]